MKPSFLDMVGGIILCLLFLGIAIIPMIALSSHHREIIYTNQNYHDN
jgi:hypothetical protein